MRRASMLLHGISIALSVGLAAVTLVLIISPHFHSHHNIPTQISLVTGALVTAGATALYTMIPKSYGLVIAGQALTAGSFMATLALDKYTLSGLTQAQLVLATATIFSHGCSMMRILTLEHTHCDLETQNREQGKGVQMKASAATLVNEGNWMNEYPTFDTVKRTIVDPKKLIESTQAGTPKITPPAAFAKIPLPTIEDYNTQNISAESLNSMEKVAAERSAIERLPPLLLPPWLNEAPGKSTSASPVASKSTSPVASKTTSPVASKSTSPVMQDIPKMPSTPVGTYNFGGLSLPPGVSSVEVPIALPSVEIVPAIEVTCSSAKNNENLAEVCTPVSNPLLKFQPRELTPPEYNALEDMFHKENDYADIFKHQQSKSLTSLQYSPVAKSNSHHRSSSYQWISHHMLSSPSRSSNRDRSSSFHKVSSHHPLKSHQQLNSHKRSNSLLSAGSSPSRRIKMHISNKLSISDLDELHTSPGQRIKRHISKKLSLSSIKDVDVDFPFVRELQSSPTKLHVLSQGDKKLSI